MRLLELKVPPPIVALVCALLMYGAVRLVPGWHWNWSGSGIAGAGVMLAGIMLDLAGVLAFWRAKTTVNPLAPASTSTLVQSGIYRFTRNPMYLGMLLILSGFGLYLAHPLPFLLLPVFLAYITRFQIIPEERVLATRFGPEYAAYAARVRRWI